MRSLEASVDDSGAVRGGVVAPAGWMARDRRMMFARWGQPPVQAVVPLRPLPLGTAVNSLMFAAPLLLVPISRRIRRRSRARCNRKSIGVVDGARPISIAVLKASGIGASSPVSAWTATATL